MAISILMSNLPLDKLMKLSALRDQKGIPAVTKHLLISSISNIEWKSSGIQLLSLKIALPFTGDYS